MIAELRSYSRYTNTGVPWLADVPAHWQVRRLKTLCTSSALYGANVAATSYTTKGVRFLRTTDITEDGQLRSEGVFVPEELVQDYVLADDDLLLSRSGTIGRSLLYSCRDHGRCAYAGYLVRFVPATVVLPKYLFWFTKTPAFAGFLRVMAISSTIENVNGEKYANAALPLPPLSEQAAIVRFLDHADRRIRRYIRAKQKLIALLEEQKQAIIHEAVTGRIDVRTGRPYPAYKPCGLEWLGDLGDAPEHWDVVRLSRLIRSGPKNGVSPPPDEHGSLVSFAISAVRNGSLDVRDTDRKTVSGDGIAVDTYNLLADDILLVRGNGNLRLVGRAGLVERDMPGCIYPDLLMRLRLTERAVPRFVVALLSSPSARSQVESSAHTAVGTFKINSHDVRQLWLALPDIPEQLRILAYVSERTRPLVDLGNQTTRSVELMREYRARAIGDVVTGKLDVRKAAAGLAELDPLAAEEDSLDEFTLPSALEHRADAQERGLVPAVVDAEWSEEAAEHDG